MILPKIMLWAFEKKLSSFKQLVGHFEEVLFGHTTEAQKAFIEEAASECKSSSEEAQTDNEHTPSVRALPPHEAELQIALLWIAKSVEAFLQLKSFSNGTQSQNAIDAAKEWMDAAQNSISKFMGLVMKPNGLKRRDFAPLSRFARYESICIALLLHAAVNKVTSMFQLASRRAIRRQRKARNGKGRRPRVAEKVAGLHHLHLRCNWQRQHQMH